MNDIKVYIQYPWKFRDSNYYKKMVEFPPKGVLYLNATSSGENTINRKKLFVSNYIKKILRMPFKKFNLSMINTKKTNTNLNYEVIHCAHCLSLNKSPWVADFESTWQFFLSGKIKESSKRKVEKIILSEDCKRILPWTEATRKEISKMFPKKEIKNKLETVTYALAPPKKIKKDKDKINLLYVSRYFYQKGGFQSIKVLDLLTKKYDNVNATFISSTPKEVYEKYQDNKKIKMLEMQPWDRVYNKIMPKSDIFINPGFTDTFGFLFIEALANGLPVITVDGYARKEIINKKQGFVLDRPKIGWDNEKPVIKKETELINDLVKKTSLLIENKKIRNQMANEGRKEILEGKFSLKERNKKLKEIYEDSIRK
jgi:glycosyltransferase involved in cell wall biosynthesis